MHSDTGAHVHKVGGSRCGPRTWTRARTVGRYVFYYWMASFPDCESTWQLVYYNFIVFSLPGLICARPACLPLLPDPLRSSDARTLGFRRGSFPVGINLVGGGAGGMTRGFYIRYADEELVQISLVWMSDRGLSVLLFVVLVLGPWWETFASWNRAVAAAIMWGRCVC